MMIFEDTMKRQALKRHELNFIKDMNSLPKFRKGYLEYLRSPKHQVEQILDRLDAERRFRV